MKVIVTGATGFIGRHLVARLLERQHTVTAVTRDPKKAEQFQWSGQVRFVAADINTLHERVRERLGEADVIAHLAWPGLPNYKGLFHYERNLPDSYAFLSAAVNEGYARLLVTGTCFEYGMQAGCLKEDGHTQPDNPYGLAKDTLRKFLESLQHESDFGLQWCRLFYMSGEGQNEKSLLSQLDRAIDRRDDVFAMSGGEQIRDFLPVTEIARRLVHLLESPAALGTFNICSGAPISIRRLVEERIRERGSEIRPNLGVYSYPDYEPLAFWGDSTRYHTIESK